VKSAHPRHRRAGGLVAVALLAAAFVGATPAAAQALAPEPPSCTVTLEATSAVARPTSTAADSLTFRGNVHVTLGSLGGSRTLHINATPFPEHWAASVDPATREVSGVTDVNFTATLAVPPAELTATSGRLVITAHFQWFQGSEDPKEECSNQATIQVAQYYGLNADTDTPRIQVKTGPVGSTAAVIVQNLGNGRDTFRVELENRAELEVLGIITSLPLQATLNADQESNITFTVNASSAAEEGTYDLFIMVTSTTDPALRRDTQVTVEVTKTIVDKIFDPTVIVVLSAVGAAGLGTLAAIRSRRRRRRAREARRLLARIRRQQREGQAGAAGDGEAEPGRAARVRPEAPDEGAP